MRILVLVCASFANVRLVRSFSRAYIHCVHAQETHIQRHFRALCSNVCHFCSTFPFPFPQHTFLLLRKSRTFKNMKKSLVQILSIIGLQGHHQHPLLHLHLHLHLHLLLRMNRATPMHHPHMRPRQYTRTGSLHMLSPRTLTRKAIRFCVCVCLLPSCLWAVSCEIRTHCCIVLVG